MGIFMVKEPWVFLPEYLVLLFDCLTLWQKIKEHNSIEIEKKQ
jgi:hypothetical protein